MEAQVGKGHYRLGEYVDESRFVSYYSQIAEILDRAPESVLEVGVGDHVLGNYLKSNTDISYISIDIAEDLHPDVIGSVTELPFKDKEFDMACAFGVLEHLPFEESCLALSELARVTRRYLVISVPHFGPMLAFSLKIPFFPQFRFAWKIPYPKKHIFNGQHYWEVGKKGYPASKIRKELETYGAVERDYVPFNSAYHHFYVINLAPTVMTKNI